MRELNIHDLPGGLPVVQDWIEELYSEAPGIGLWTRLDDRLRLALAQAWILNTSGQPDDEAAGALSEPISRHSSFGRMLADHIERWHSVYVSIKDDHGVLAQPEAVGVDAELVVLVEPRFCGPVEGDTPAWGHTFITRLTSNGWQIGGLARRVPVPGWPPTEQEIPGLSIDG